MSSSNLDAQGSISLGEEAVIVYGDMSHRSKWYAVGALFTLATMTQANLYTLPNLYAIATSEGQDYSIKKDLSISETEFGLLVSYLGITPRVVAMLFTGRAATYIATEFRHGNKAMLSAASGLVQLAGLSMYLTADSFATLAPAVGLLNLGVGLNTPMNSIIIGDIFAPTDRALPVALVITADYLGAGIAALSQPLALRVGWRLAILVYSFFTFIAFVATFTLSYILRQESVKMMMVASISNVSDRLLLTDALVTTNKTSSNSTYADRVTSSVDDVSLCHSYAPPTETSSSPLHQSLIDNTSPMVVQHDKTIITSTISSKNTPTHAEKGNGYIPVVDRLIQIHDQDQDENQDPDMDQNQEVENQDAEEIQEEQNDISDDQDPDGQPVPDSNRFEIRKQWGAFFLIMSSPQLKLVYLGGGIRYGAGMAIASYNPQFFAQAYPKLGKTSYPLHATISVTIMGSLAQYFSAKLTPKFPGLTIPVLACLGGFLASTAIYLSTDFSFAIFMLYLTWLLGEGWFVGVVTTIQKTLPAGIARDTGLGFFFASSVLIGAADVFSISQEGIDADDDKPNDDMLDDDDGDDGGGGFIWHWLLHGKKHNKARQAMLTGISFGYLLAACVFVLASFAPLLWPCLKTGKKK